MMPERSFLSATAETPSRLSISSWLSARPPWPAAAGGAPPGPPPLRASLRSASAQEAASESSRGAGGLRGPGLVLVVRHPDHRRPLGGDRVLVRSGCPVRLRHRF